MTDNIIQLVEDDVLRFKIVDKEGKETGESLEFDLEDIDLLIRYQTLLEEDKKARLNIKNQFTIIDKKQDHKGKKLLSANEEAKIKATQDFYRKEVEIYNGFLGERGVEKLLNGRKINWSCFDYIDEIIDKQIMPKIKISADNFKDKIMKKYSNNKKDDVIE